MDLIDGINASLISISQLVDDAKCFEAARKLRWPNGIRCTRCQSYNVIRNGHDSTQVHRQRYWCKDCSASFDDLTGTVFEGHRQPLRMWILCLYFMGLNLSNRQIAAELGLNKDDVQQMTRTLRKGVEAKRPLVQLEGEVECDEVYVIAGHKGRPAAVKKKGADPEGDA